MTDKNINDIITQLATDFAIEKHGDKKFTPEIQKQFEEDVVLFSEKLARGYGLICYDAYKLADKMGQVMQSQVEAIEKQLAEIQRGVSFCRTFEAPVIVFSTSDAKVIPPSCNNQCK